MKRVILTLSILMLAGSVMAVQPVPARQVLPNGAAWTQLPNTNLQGVLDYIDNNSTNIDYAPIVTTNTDVTVRTPRWTGDIVLTYGTNAYATRIWIAWAANTNSWLLVYPSMALTSTNEVSTNIVPIAAGQQLAITGATNILWQAFSGTNGVLGWKAIYRGGP
jgi:hypothetical protein